jgi:hypothetical protein
LLQEANREVTTERETKLVKQLSAKWDRDEESLAVRQAQEDAAMARRLLEEEEAEIMRRRAEKEAADAALAEKLEREESDALMAAKLFVAEKEQALQLQKQRELAAAADEEAAKRLAMAEESLASAHAERAAADAALAMKLQEAEVEGLDRALTTLKEMWANPDVTAEDIDGKGVRLTMKLPGLGGLKVTPDADTGALHITALPNRDLLIQGGMPTALPAHMVEETLDIDLNLDIVGKTKPRPEDVTYTYDAKTWVATIEISNAVLSSETSTEKIASDAKSRFGGALRRMFSWRKHAPPSPMKKSRPPKPASAPTAGEWVE